MNSHVPRRAKGPAGKTPFGDRLWYARQALGGLSQEKLAARAPDELHRLTVQGLESGRYKGNSAIVIKGLAAALGVEVSHALAYFDGRFGPPSLRAAQRFISTGIRKTDAHLSYSTRESAIILLVNDGRGDEETIRQASERAMNSLEIDEHQSELRWVEAIAPFIPTSRPKGRKK